MEKEGQVKAVGIVSIIWGILIFLGVSFALFLSIGSSIDYILMEVLIVAIFIIGYSSSLGFIIAGIFLMKYRNWARILLIVLAIMNLLNFPIGTGFGIWFLIVLFDDEVKKLFSKSSEIRC